MRRGRYYGCLNFLESDITLSCRSCNRFEIDWTTLFQDAASRLGNIAPVDLAQAAIGPGMAIFTRYARVLDAGGKFQCPSERPSPSSTRQPGRGAGRRRRLCGLRHRHCRGCARGDWPGFDQSRVSARGSTAWQKPSPRPRTLVSPGWWQAGILTSGGGKVRLLAPTESAPRLEPEGGCRIQGRCVRTVWETTHHLVRVHSQGGDAAAVDCRHHGQHRRRRRNGARPGLSPLSGASATCATVLRGAGIQRFRPSSAAGEKSPAWQREIPGATSPDGAEYVRWGVSHGRHQQ